MDEILHRSVKGVKNMCGGHFVLADTTGKLGGGSLLEVQAWWYGIVASAEHR